MKADHIVQQAYAYPYTDLRLRKQLPRINRHVGRVLDHGKSEY